MKKVLFATTALVATASVAAADVTFSGMSRFGVIYTDDGTTTSTDQTSRFLLNIDGSATTDGGMTVGARVRVRQNNGDTTGRDTGGFNSARFHLTTGGLTMRVGNINGAMDSAPSVYAGTVGLTGLGFGNVVTGFQSQFYSSEGMGAAVDNEGVEVVYSMGDYAVHVSADGTTTEVVASGTMNGITAAVGVSNADAADARADVLATVGGSVGSVDVALAYASISNDVTRTTLSMGMDIGAATGLRAYVADNGAADDNMNFGVGVNHSLGGGVSLAGGVVSIAGNPRADLGVTFNF